MHERCVDIFIARTLCRKRKESAKKTFKKVDAKGLPEKMIMAASFFICYSVHTHEASVCVYVCVCTVVCTTPLHMAIQLGMKSILVKFPWSFRGKVNQRRDRRSFCIFFTGITMQRDWESRREGNALDTFLFVLRCSGSFIFVFMAFLMQHISEI